MTLNLLTDTVAGVPVVIVDGELDCSTAGQLRDHLAALTGQGHRLIVVELDKCGFIDATGLGVLVNARKRVLGDGGGIAVACTVERIVKLFRLTGLARVFGDKVSGLHDTADGAAAALLRLRAGDAG